jgi:hypothetical protein
MVNNFQNVWKKNLMIFTNIFENRTHNLCEAIHCPTTRLLLYVQIQSAFHVLILDCQNFEIFNLRLPNLFFQNK